MKSSDEKPPFEGMTTRPMGLPMMYDAWMGLVIWSSTQEGALAAFKADTGFDLESLLRASALDQMIDQATGHGKTVCLAWLDWVTRTQWGEEPVTGSIQYVKGQRVLFLKSMCECEFVEMHADGEFCTVQKVEGGKKMTATLKGIRLIGGQGVTAPT